MKRNDSYTIDRLILAYGSLEVISHIFDIWVVEPVDILRMVIDDIADKPHQKLKIKEELGIEL